MRPNGRARGNLRACGTGKLRGAKAQKPDRTATRIFYDARFLLRDASRSGGMSYLLQVKLHGRWVTVLAVEARSHVEAFGQATLRLPIEYYDKPVRLEQVEGEQSPPAGDRTSGARRGATDAPAGTASARHEAVPEGEVD